MGIQKEKIIKDYKNGLSLRKLEVKYNISKGILRRKIIPKKIIRNYSEASTNAHSMYKESFKHSQESKKKMRKSRLAYMKKHPEKTAWRKSNMSYPEKLFLDAISNYPEYLIEREKSFYPYFADFTILNAKVVIEIDGSQHEIPSRKQSDEIKDTLILSKGYRVIRFKALEVINDIDSVINTLINFINSDTLILKSEFISIKEAKEASFLEQKLQTEELKNKRHLIRLNDIKNTLNKRGSISKLSNKWNISHTSVRRWILKYYPDFYKKE